MEKLFNTLKELTHLLIIVALVSLSVIYSITYNVGASTRFVPFVANAISLIFILAILITSLLLIVFRKDKQANMILYVYALYYLITYIFNYIACGFLVRQGASAMSIVYGIFYFLGGLLLLAIITILTLVEVFEFKLNKILDLLVLIMVAYFVVLFVVGLIRAININSNWSAYFTLIAEALIMPMLLASLYIERRKPVATKTTEEKVESEENSENI